MKNYRNIILLVCFWAFPALATVVQTNYDENTGAAMSTKVSNEYDEYGIYS